MRLRAEGGASGPGRITTMRDYHQLHMTQPIHEWTSAIAPELAERLLGMRLTPLELRACLRVAAHLRACRSSVRCSEQFERAYEKRYGTPLAFWVYCVNEWPMPVTMSFLEPEDYSSVKETEEDRARRRAPAELVPMDEPIRLDEPTRTSTPQDRCHALATPEELNRLGYRPLVSSAQRFGAAESTDPHAPGGDRDHPRAGG